MARFSVPVTTEEFAQQSSGTIIAGEADTQKLFHVRKETLEKSPIIKGWIEDPDSMPESLRKDGALYLANCQPDVVFTLIRYLERDEANSSDDDFINEAAIVKLCAQDPLFYFRVYKLAGSLAVEGLCVIALNKIQTSKFSTETFIKIAIEAERGKLVEGKRFRDWMIAYVKQNFETLSESKLLQATIKEGGQNSWVICSVLMSCLSHVGAEATRSHTPQRSYNARAASNPFPTASFSSYSSSGRPPAGPPSSARYSISYTNSIEKYPNLSPEASSDRVEKKHEVNERNLNATVEDASSSEGENCS